MRTVRWLGVIVGLLVAGCGGPAGGTAAPVDSPTSTSERVGEETSFARQWLDDGEAPPVVGFDTGEVASPTTVVSVAEPVAVRVPSVEIGVELDPLGLEDDGRLEVPDDFDRGGWYAQGPRPGEVGPAVITAHVDSLDGPAPFFRLREVSAGDEIEVLLADGRVERFVVSRVEQHPKDEFPTLQVYGNTVGPELRLITCGGEFDRSERSYRHNIIVWAEPVT